MKRILQFILLTAFVFLCKCCYAQVPSLMRYQAVVRDAAGDLLVSKPVGIQISILKGTATGVADYIETQAPTTNANGLFSISIGAGTPVAGSYTGIDWSSGKYYMKVDISLTSSAVYTITSTAEILSVPYAINAQSANKLTGQDLHAHLDTLFLTGNEYTIIPGLRSLALLGNVQRLLGSGFTPLELYNIGYPLDSLYGKTYQGGVLYWLDINTGHGLIAAPTDLNERIVWSDIPIAQQIETSMDIGTGQMNTTNIVQVLKLVRGGGKAPITDANYAAADCDRLVMGGFDDWYLPSVDELILFAQLAGQRFKAHVNFFAFKEDGSYWTSSNLSGETAYTVRLMDKSIEGITFAGQVRPIRSF